MPKERKSTKSREISSLPILGFVLDGLFGLETCLLPIGGMNGNANCSEFDAKVKNENVTPEMG